MGHIFLECSVNGLLLGFILQPCLASFAVTYPATTLPSIQPAKKKGLSPNRELNTGLVSFEMETLCTDPTTRLFGLCWWY